MGYVNSQTVVKLLLPDNCSANIDTTSIVKNQIAATDFTMKVSPNPTNGKFLLNLSASDKIAKATISIYSQVGETIYTETIYCDSRKLAKQINLDNVLAGVYIIKCVTDTKETLTKLIIK